MKYNLNHLKLFYHVAKYRSFTIAAEKLFLTQPGISKQIKDLENFYSCQLLERSGKKIFLTNAGEILFEAAKSAFNTLDSAQLRIEDLKQVKSGRIKLLSGYTPGIHILPDILLKFREQYSKVSIHYDISTSDQIFNCLINNTIDLGITAKKGDSRFTSIPFIKDEMVLAIPRNHSLSTLEKINIADLHDCEILVTKEGSATRNLIDEANTNFKLNMKFIEIGSPFAIIKSIESGNGISIVSKFEVEKEANKEHIQIISLQGIKSKRNFYLNYRKNKYIFSAMNAFITFFLEEYDIKE